LLLREGAGTSLSSSFCQGGHRYCNHLRDDVCYDVQLSVPGEGLVSFEADRGSASPWNAVVGGSVAFSRLWEWVVEHGFNLKDVQLVITGLAFRFSVNVCTGFF
jgi:hypothetical protein